MLKLKKFIAIFIALIMVLSLLAACGGGDKKTDSKTDQNNGQSQDHKDGTGDVDDEEIDDPTFEGLKFKPKNYNFNGKEIVFSGWQGALPEKGVNAVWDRMLTMREKTEKKYNIKIKQINPTSEHVFVDEVLAQFSAGLKYADIIFCPSTYGLKLLKIKGLVIPLDDYIDYNSDRFKLAGIYSLYIDGKHYSCSEVDPGVGYMTYYNPEILKRKGVEDIFELYQKGEWNWDKLLEIAKKITDDEIKAIGGSFVLDSIFASNGVKVIDMDTKNNRFISGLYTESGEKALNFLRQLAFEIKAVDQWYGGNNSIININKGITAMVMAPGYYGPHFIKAGTPIKSAPLPKGPDVSGPVAMSQFSTWNLVSAISDFTPEEALTVYYDSQRNDPNDPEVYIPDTEEDRLEQFLQEYLDAGNTWATEEEAIFWFNFAYNDESVIHMLEYSPAGTQDLLKRELYDPIASGEDPRTCLETIRPIIETALKEMEPEK